MLIRMQKPFEAGSHEAIQGFANHRQQTNRPKSFRIIGRIVARLGYKFNDCLLKNRREDPAIKAFIEKESNL
jgi:hypothetical protein